MAFVVRDAAVEVASVPVVEGGAAPIGGRDASADGLAPDRETVAPSAALMLAPPGVDCGFVTVGTSEDTALELTNVGELASGLPDLALSGADTDQFSIVSTECGARLPAGGRCAIVVRFTPTVQGSKSCVLSAKATPGGLTMTALTGRGATPGALAITPAGPANFDPVAPGTTPAAMTFTVTNTGDTSTGALEVSLTGSTEFQIVTDGCSGQTLPAAGSCRVMVAPSIGSSGPKNAALVVEASPGGAVSVVLTVVGLRPAFLAAAPTTHDFGMIEAGVATPAISWTVTNTGDVASGDLSVSNDDPSEVTLVSNSCVGALGAGASCVVTLTFRPNTSGSRTGSVKVTSSTGTFLTLGLSAYGLWRLTLVLTGTGTVTSTPSGISCSGGSCSGLFLPRAVNLAARTQNGSGFRFAGWGGDLCSGVFRDCPLTLTAPTTVSATFAPMTNNLVFATADKVPADLGSAVAYDATCNAAATAAGLNNADGTGFVAFVSDATSLAKTRLGSAQGWIRMDGKPFAVSQSALFVKNQVLNSIHFDEFGDESAAWFSFVMTGASADGTLAPPSLTCNNWTSSNANLNAGYPDGGPISWAEGAGGQCSPTRIVCMGKTMTVSPSPIVSSGSKVWITKAGFVPGGTQTPDAQCQAERPAGVTRAAALVAYPAQAASAVLLPTANYVRVDGTLVGTGVQIAAGTLESGIWQFGDGTYPSVPLNAWNGASTPSATGTVTTTCSNWSSSNASGTLGFASSVYGFWGEFPDLSCGQDGRLYCVQAAP